MGFFNLYFRHNLFIMPNLQRNFDNLNKIRLGLDLKGGMHLLLEVDDKEVIKKN